MAADGDSPYDFAPGQEPAKKAPQPAPSAATEEPKAPTRRECPFCGHVFFGKPRAHCPECAAPLDAGSADELQYAAPLWVRRLGTGALLLSAGAVGHFAGIVLRIFQMLFLDVTARHAKGITHAAAALLICIGAWLLTLGDPRAANRNRTRRVTIRILVAAVTILWLILGAIALHWLDVDEASIRWLVSATIFCQMPLLVVLGFHIADLALRLPDDRIAAHAKLDAWLLAGCSLFLMLVWMSDAIAPALGFFPISFPVATAVLVLVAWAAWTLLGFGRDLHAAAQAGEEIALRRARNIAARDKTAGKA